LLIADRAGGLVDDANHAAAGKNNKQAPLLWPRLKADGDFVIHVRGEIDG